MHNHHNREIPIQITNTRQ